MAKDVMLIIRIDQDLKNALKEKKNYSDYIRNLIIDDLMKSKSPSYIKNKIKKLEKEIEQLNSAV